MDREQVLVNMLGALMTKAGLQQMDSQIDQLESFARDMSVKVSRAGSRIVVSVARRSVALPSEVDLLLVRNGR